ncbi:unnamed protein product [Wuchereria bancrofti]|uniref:Uncharacterized protein n=1 Tax=Wuchereria bancrofti TaxID=6293 RepID=A0A3P7FK58_WUCBA|nr:unnamed protein product [Wuchereria bancrofti]
MKKGHSIDGWKNESEDDNKDVLRLNLSRLLCVVPSRFGWKSQDVCYAIFQHSSDAVSSTSFKEIERREDEQKSSEGKHKRR